jgi:hypothetical protein
VNKASAALNRILVFLVGAVLLSMAALVAAWYANIPAVREWVSRVDRTTLAAAPQQPWWQWAVTGLAIASLALGAGVLAVDLARRRTSAVAVPDDDGSVTTVDLDSLAMALAGQLTGFPGVRFARGRAVLQQGLPTLEVRVDADATLDLVAFSQISEALAATAAHSVGGAKVATQVQLRLSPTDAEPAQRD